MRKVFLATLLAIVLVAAAAAAQTPAAPAPGGAFDTLSPGNQKIARALFEAQQDTDTTTPLSLDEIAKLKQSQGWGKVFREMKSQGLLEEKNLGQIVSRFHRPKHSRAPGEGALTPRGGRSHVGERVRVRGATLEDVEQRLFDQQEGLARRDAAFEARFRDLSLSRADQQKLLEDVRNLNQIPEGSRVRLDGRIDNRPFRADVRNHKGELEINMKGIQFGSAEEAQAFMDSVRQSGADRVRVKGTIDGQRFDARFRDHNGRVAERLRIKGSESGTQITTASGRTHLAQSHESRSANGRMFDDGRRPKLSGDHGRASFESSGVSGAGQGGHGGNKSAFSGSGQSGKGGHGRHGKN